MGIIKAGGAYLPLDIAYPEERVRFMIEDAGASIMLTERSVADKLGGSGCLMVYMDADRNQISRQSGENIELTER
jgi:non-ribosomal peptide synthetase component F